LVQVGLEKLAKTKKVGLVELLRICGCLKEENGNKPNAEHVGFGIAPRINAVGRLTDAAQAVRLLTTDNLIEAIHIATELESQNRERQSICEETVKEAVVLVSEQVDLKNDKCIVLAKENWHHGVIGIVA
jgi:single-stranded-DNA-specific exonuclease